jgi:ethylmalonyl-CoA mutase
VPAILAGLRAQGLAEVPVIVGGIIPAEDEAVLRSSGVADVFTPKDYDLAVVMGRVLNVVRASRGLPAFTDPSLVSSPVASKES